MEPRRAQGTRLRRDLAGIPDGAPGLPRGDPRHGRVAEGAPAARAEADPAVRSRTPVIHRGGCHCGNLRYTLTTALAVTQLPLRACQCSFCRHHGALSTSDPGGTLRFDLGDAGLLRR